MRVTIYWTQTATPKKRQKICAHFGIPGRMNINRETETDINENQYTTLLETELSGYIQIRNKHGTQQNRQTTCL